MSEKQLAAAFFLAAGDSPADPTALALAAGVVDGRWDGVACRSVFVEHLEWHDALVITFWQDDFLELLSEETESPLPLERDPALPLAYTFRDACEALSPVAAVLVTRPRDDLMHYIGGLEEMVLSYDANGLAAAGAGLLYLSEELAAMWTADAIRDDRDEVPVSGGAKLVFSQRGWGRWF